MVNKAKNPSEPPKSKPSKANKPKQPPQPRNARKKKQPEPEEDIYLSNTTMGIDHYKVLGVDRNASPDELRKSYMKLAMDWHPDKHQQDQEQKRAEANAKFKEINESYSMLNDPEKRKFYDQQFNQINNNSSPLGFQVDVYTKLFGSTEKNLKTKEQSNNYTLRCSLEELYKDTTRRIKITREVGDEKVIKEEVLTICIKPGLCHGTKITYPKKGDPHEYYGFPTDLIIMIEEKKHSVFKRDGNDLIVNQTITLLEALTGGKILELKTLDGRKISVPLAADVVRAPGDELVIPNEGMPLLNIPVKKGNLRIKFDIKFPNKLNAEQKLDVKSGLTGVLF